MLMSAKNPLLQLFWDAHSLKLLLECPRKYQYQILQGWVSSGDSIHLDWGIAYHEAMAKADMARAEGKSYYDQVDAAVETALSYPEFEGATTHKNRITLVRSVVWNLEHFRSAPLRTIEVNGKPAVELSFSFPTEIPTHTDEHFGLCGYMDGAADTDLGITVIERKSTKNALQQHYYDGFSPNLQVSMYTMASRIIFPTPARGVTLEACQTGVNFSEFGRRIFIKTPAQVDEFFREIVYWLGRADFFAQSGWWPKNEAACTFCAFKKICGKDPNVRDQFFQDPANFKQHPWNPLEPR
jgi:hypothetical protein